MEWEEKKELGITKILDDIEETTKVVVNQQLKDIKAQFHSLESMQIIPESEKSKFQNLMDEFEKQLVDMQMVLKK